MQLGSDSGTGEFDNARIRHELEKNLFRYRLCPVLDTQLTEQVLALFPERVNPRTDKDWKYVEDYGGTILICAVGGRVLLACVARLTGGRAAYRV